MLTVILPAVDGDTGPAEGAAYWASLLSEFAGHLREEDHNDLTKGLRKRNRTEKVAAALAGDLVHQPS